MSNPIKGPERTDDDSRSDLKQAVESRSDAADAANGGDDGSPLEPTGVDDGVSGTAGVVKNQDKTQQ
ncbi:hypothetical protein [Sphingosinithalassobacter sp. CS137]|uniref:hypothetical protein n=1 Tax=Sphingosinithalassobacter sp. CS137 TaxID=2762748 RepID=UPI00165EA24D|nr:hypothetical protein [Sphingosinithalassobacter sp. CS137]